MVWIKFYWFNCFSVLFLIRLTHQKIADGEKNENWKQNLTPQMKIGVPEGGYTKVVLECSSDWMAFVISTEVDFHGSIYARGNFYKQSPPCFLNASKGKDFALKMPYEDCGIERDEELGGFVTTVIVQHDKELITPGDLGFTLICKDEIKVEASLDGMHRSKIIAVDPDPSAKTFGDGSFSAMSPKNIVTLTPPKFDLKPPKQEL